MSSATVKFKLRRDTASNWNTNNTTLQNGEPGYDSTNGLLKLGNGTNPWKTLNATTSILGRTPEEFGAVGDGVTDDGDAIASWASSGGANLFLPAKTYLIKRRNAAGANRSGISFVNARIIRGAGPTSVLQFDASAADSPAWYGCFGIASNTTFSDLKMYFNGCTSPSTDLMGCSVGNVSNVTFARVTVDSNLSFNASGVGNTKIYWLSLGGNSSDFLFEDCDISKCSYSILKTNDSINTVRRYKFLGGYWHDSVVHIPFNSPSAICDDITIQGVSFNNQTQLSNQEAMVTFASVTNFSIVDCIFYGQFCREAIHIEQDCRKFTITGNVINIDSQLTDTPSIAGNAIQILSNNIGPTPKFSAAMASPSTTFNYTLAAPSGCPLLPGMILSGTDASGAAIPTNMVYIKSVSGTSCTLNTAITISGSCGATAGPTVIFNASGTPLSASFTGTTSSAYSTTVTVSSVSGSIVTGMSLSNTSAGTFSAKTYIQPGVYVVSTNISGTSGTIEVNTPICIGSIGCTGAGTILTVSGNMIQGTSILPGMAITRGGEENTDGTYVVYGEDNLWYLNNSKTFSRSDRLTGTPGYANPTVNSLSGRTITVSSGTGIQVGMNVFGTGIPASTIISAPGSNLTTWILSATPEATVSGTSITAYANSRYNCIEGTICNNVITHKVNNNLNAAINVVWDGFRVSGGENIVITNNVIANYKTGIGLAQNMLMGTVIADNILKKCITGIFTVFGSQSIRNNVFESCSAAFASQSGGLLGRQTFINTKNYGKSTNGYLTLNGWDSSITSSISSLDNASQIGTINTVLCFAGAAFSGTFSLRSSVDSIHSDVFAKYKNSSTPLYGRGCPFVNQPEGLAVGTDGTIYISDTGNNQIKTCFANGTGMLVLISSGLSSPKTIALDISGNLLIADSGNNAIKKWTRSTGTVTPIITLTSPYGVAVDISGNIYTTQTGTFAVKKWTSAGVDNSTAGATLFNARGLTVDSSGKAYIAEFYNGGQPGTGSLRTWSGVSGAAYVTISGSTNKSWTGATINTANTSVFFTNEPTSALVSYNVAGGESAAAPLTTVASTIEIAGPKAAAWSPATVSGPVIMSIGGSINDVGTFNTIKSWRVGDPSFTFTSIVKSDPYVEPESSSIFPSGSSTIFSSSGGGLFLGSEANPNKTLQVRMFSANTSSVPTDLNLNVTFNGTHIINPAT